MVWNKEVNIRNAGHWLSRQIELIELKHDQHVNGTIITIHRGGVFNVELGEGNIGGEKNKKRPCLVITRDTLNQGDTTVMFPLTTKFSYELKNGIKIPRYKNHYILYKSDYPFLGNDSCVKCEDIRVIDKVRVREHLGNILPTHLSMLEKRILYTLGF